MLDRTKPALEFAILDTHGSKRFADMLWSEWELGATNLVVPVTQQSTNPLVAPRFAPTRQDETDAARWEAEDALDLPLSVSKARIGSKPAFPQSRSFLSLLRHGRCLLYFALVR